MAITVEDAGASIHYFDSVNEVDVLFNKDDFWSRRKGTEIFLYDGENNYNFEFADVTTSEVDAKAFILSLNAFLPPAEGVGTTPRVQLSQYLSDAGDGTGVIDGSVDYSAGLKIFYIQPPSGAVYVLETFLVVIKDSQSFDPDNYGRNLTLTNGIIMRKEDDSSTIVDFTTNHKIFTNLDWAIIATPSGTTFDSGDAILGAEMNFRSRFGQPLKLDGDNNERLEIVLNDDFSPLNGHFFQTQGYIQ